MRATFFNSEGAKINDSMGLPGVRPPGYAPAFRHSSVILRACATYEGKIMALEIFAGGIWVFRNVQR